MLFEGGILTGGVPGGAMLNSAVSLGRAGLPVFFITEFGNDKLGEVIRQFLKKNNVDTTYIKQYGNGKTAISIAFLDSKKDASYSFYKNYPPGRLTQVMPVLRENDLLLFGSFFSLQSEIREQVFSFVSQSALSGAVVLYDPNIRATHKNEIAGLLPLIDENISIASIVRGSDEDFETIFNTTGASEAYSRISALGCPNLIFTSSGKGVYLITPKLNRFYNIPQIVPVSTIGAGDNFNAGVLYALFQMKISKTDINSLEKSSWDFIIKTAISFATNVCLNHENYISNGFATGLQL